MAIGVEVDARIKSVCPRVVAVDHGIDAEHAKRSGARSGLGHKCGRDPGSARSLIDRESVQVTTPSVPSDDQRPTISPASSATMSASASRAKSALASGI